MALALTPAQLLGSKTARNGFANEKDIRDKFNNWSFDLDAQDWLTALGHQPNKLKSVVATKAPPRIKPDIFLEVIDINNQKTNERISIKLVSNINSGFNQVDKRWVQDYAALWSMQSSTSNLLKLFTGENPHGIKNTKASKRLFLNEFSGLDQSTIINFFAQNKNLVISDLFEGRNLKANWMMVTAKSGTQIYWKIRPMAFVLNLFSRGPVLITSRGSLKIGAVTMQRKGGDNGRPSAKMLQFKANPLLLF